MRYTLPACGARAASGGAPKASPRSSASPALRLFMVHRGAWRLDPVTEDIAWTRLSASAQPSPGDPLVLARCLGEMEPRVHPSLDGCVPAGKQPRHLPILQRLVRIDGTQSGTQLLLDDRLHGLRDHHVGI